MSDIENFGLEEKQTVEIKKAFLPKIEEREGYVPIYKELLSLEINKDTCNRAGELRKKLVKVRTGIAEIHKTQKAYSLAYGRFVDAWKKKETEPILQMEESLEQIEKYYEIQEQKRLKILQEEREVLLSMYVDDAAERDLSSMEADVWEAFLDKKKKEYQERIIAEEKAEKERIKREKAEKVYNERLLVLARYGQLYDNIEPISIDTSDKEYKAIILKLEYEKRQEQERQDKIKAEAEAKLAEQKRIADEAEAKRQEAVSKQEAADRKLRAERAAAAKEKAELEAKLKAVEEAEAKTAREAEAKRQYELNKVDSDKIKDLIYDLTLLKYKYTFSSDIYKEIYRNTNILIDKIATYIKSKKPE